MAQTVFDRRGVHPFMILCLIMVPVSIILMIMYSWKIGLALAMSSCVGFITLEAVSARPDNNPVAFLRWVQRLPANQKRRPILLCLGDSLMHGNMSASITPEIPLKLTQKIGLPPADYGTTFCDPLWVVNAGQNTITSHTVLHERLALALQVYPDFVVILIGTNDVCAMYGQPFQTLIPLINKLPTMPSMESYQSNLTAIIKMIHAASPLTQVGICTLPMLGEDLKSKSNQLIRRANGVIAKVAEVAGDRVTVIPVFDAMETFLEKNRSSFQLLPLQVTYLAAFWMNPLFHMTALKSWNLLSRPLGHQLLSDGIHLNERGRDIVADAIVDWLLAKHVTKAIAVKG